MFYPFLCYLVLSKAIWGGGGPEAAKRFKLGWKQVWGEEGTPGSGRCLGIFPFFGAAQFTASPLTSGSPTRKGDAEGFPPLPQGLPHPYMAELDHMGQK